MILGVDYVDTEVQALPYLKRLGITYPNGPDLQMKLAETFRVTGFRKHLYLIAAAIWHL
jgi:cytochrome c biogenesis protein CcmG/thiol:disulfide interchange protein DsbE